MPQIAALSLRLACASVLMTARTRMAELIPVHSTAQDDPNASFAQGPAKATFHLAITNPDAFDFLQPDMQYDIVMVPTGAYAISLQPLDASIGSADAQGEETPPADPIPALAPAPAPEVDAGALAAAATAAAAAPPTPEPDAATEATDTAPPAAAIAPAPAAADPAPEA